MDDQEYFLGSGPASTAYEAAAVAAAAAAASGPGSGAGGLPSLPVGLNGGYYGALPVAVPAHSSAPVGVLGPSSQMAGLVGAPGSVSSAAPAVAAAAATAPVAGLSKLWLSSFYARTPRFQRRSFHLIQPAWPVVASRECLVPSIVTAAAVRLRSSLPFEPHIGQPSTAQSVYGGANHLVSISQRQRLLSLGVC